MRRKPLPRRSPILTGPQKTGRRAFCSRCICRASTVLNSSGRRGARGTERFHDGNGDVPNVRAREEGGRVDDKAFLVAVSRELEGSRLKIVISGWFSSLREAAASSRSIVAWVLLGLAIAD